MQGYMMTPNRQKAVTVSPDIASKLNEGGDLVAPDATCSCRGKPAQPGQHGAVCALKEKRGSV